jgi:hypothetical protein
MHPNRDWVAIILAAGVATALNLIVLGILYDAIVNGGNQGAGISSNATQILMAWGGGMIGILGAVFGYRAGTNGDRASTDAGTPTGTDPTTGTDEV